MNIISNHVPFFRLVDIAEKRVPLDEHSNEHMHLTRCPRCADDLTWLEHVIGLMRTDALESAPDTVIARAVTLFKTRAVPPPQPYRLDTLLFDSLLMRHESAVNLRGGGAVSRQPLFGAENHELDLRILSAGEFLTIAGQLFGPAETGQVDLAQHDRTPCKHC
jgi:hypothetical protein